MSKVMVFGAAGFLASNICNYLESKDHEVYAVVRRESNQWRIENRKRVLFGDVTDQGSVDSMIKNLKPEVVINCAVYGGYNFQHDPGKIYITNVMGSINILESCISNGVGLFISTGSNSEINPTDAYGLSKLSATMYCNMRAKNQTATKVITMRVFSAFGYYEEKHRLFAQLVFNGLKGNAIHISNPNNGRNFTFTEDICEAYEKVMEKKGKLHSGSVYDIAGEYNSIKEVLETAEKVFAPKKITTVMDVSIKREADKVIYKVDRLPAKRELDWIPKTTLEQGIRKFRDWMKDNIYLYEDDALDKSKFS